MILRRYLCKHILSLLLLSALVSAADDVFDCHLTIDSLKFDLTSGEKTVTRTRDTPPTSMVDTVRLDLCAELKAQDGVAEQDQCPSGTSVCLTKTNKKADAEDRIVAVIPIAKTSSPNPKYSVLSSPKGLSLILTGPSYPYPTDSSPTPQSLNLTILCEPGASDLKFISYDRGQLQLEWSADAGCSFQGDEHEHPGDGGSSDGGGKDEDTDGNEEKERVGSGIGWFFLVLLLAFAAYLGLGAYYNYSTYGASGADLIPHRDFWREVPYMLSDVVSHLCSTVRPRRASSRSGYISV